MHEPLAIERIECEQRLRELEPSWWELWRSAPGATPFQSPAWLLAWYVCFKPGPLRCVAVHDRGRLVALAPFYVEDVGRECRLLPLGIAVSDYLDVLVEAGYEDMAGALLLNKLIDPGHGQTVCCEELIQESAALRMWAHTEWQCTLDRHSACPVTTVDPSRQVHAPRGKLRKLRMARHRVDRRKGMVATPHSNNCFLDELSRLHAARWMSRGHSGALSATAVRNFHAMALPALSRAGVLRLFWLLIDERPVGAYYGLHWRGRAYAYLAGFDPDFGHESPGTVLIGHAIEEAAREGATEFHFLRGREAYKYEWGAQDRWNSRLELRQPQ
jgi:CelD/BcsL family acetyltransferase involved in cellulose biosynthesis